MSKRREFDKPTRRDAFARAKNSCEAYLINLVYPGLLPDCKANLKAKKFHYDHIIPDAELGDPILKNCAILCVDCHSIKTNKRDKKSIARCVRLSDAEMGIKKTKQKIPSRGFKPYPSNTKQLQDL